MPIVVTIIVTSSAAVIAAGYSHIKVYRSNYQDGTFLEVSTASTRPVLDVNVTYFNFEDSSGTSSSWYKTSYYHPISLLESSPSTASRGIEVDQEFVDTTYPGETSLTSSDSFDVDRIRYYIGDTKVVKRDYVSPSSSTAYENVSSDGYTYQLENRGWPAKVVKDSVEFTSTSNPFVTDYSYLTFSGTTAINTASGVLDIWYNSFRHSDREILKVFNSTSNPPYTTTATVTDEMKRLSSAITIVRSEIAQLMGETSGSFELVGEIKYNPDPLLKHKKMLLEDLKSKLDEEVGESVIGVIEGVRID